MTISVLSAGRRWRNLQNIHAYRKIRISKRKCVAASVGERNMKTSFALTKGYLHLLENSHKLTEVLWKTSRCIPLLSIKSERETNHEIVVAMVSCKTPLYTEVSKNQHLCIISRKLPNSSLFLELSCDPASCSVPSNTPQKYSFI